MISEILHGAFLIFKSWGIPGIFLSMFIENIGIPLPTEIGYLLAQELINSTKHSFAFILFCLTLGHVVGSVASYSIGRWGDKVISKQIKKEGKLHLVHAKLKKWYDKYGTITVFITRFVGYVRPWSSYIAGFARVDFWQFLIWTTLGSLIFNIVALYFSSVLIMIWRRYEVYHVLLAVIGLILFFGLLIYELIKFGWEKHKKK